MRVILLKTLKLVLLVGTMIVSAVGTFLLILAVDNQIDMALNSHILDSQYGGRFIAEAAKIMFPIALAIGAIVAFVRMKNES